jgi:hypothetical protein
MPRTFTRLSAQGHHHGDRFSPSFPISHATLPCAAAPSLPPPPHRMSPDPRHHHHRRLMRSRLVESAMAFSRDSEIGRGVGREVRIGVDGRGGARRPGRHPPHAVTVSLCRMVLDCRTAKAPCCWPTSSAFSRR